MKPSPTPQLSKRISRILPMHISLQVRGRNMVSPEGPEWFRTSGGISSIPEIVGVQGDCFPASCTGIHHPSPKETRDMPTVRGGQGTLGGRSVDRPWLTMPIKGALKLSSEGDCNLQRSKQKVNRLVDATETNSHSSHPLSRALLSDLLFSSFSTSIHPSSKDC